MRGIGRLEYLAWGLSLGLLKAATDYIVAQVMGVQFSIWTFWFPYFTSSRQLPVVDRSAALALAAAAIPYILLGVAFTWARLRRLRWPLAYCLLFFLPIVNLLFFLVVALKADPPQEREAIPPEALQEKPHGRSAAVSVWISAAITAAGGALTLPLCLLGLQSYGWGVFFLVPFAMGMMGGILAQSLSREPLEAGHAVSAALLGQLLAGLTLVAFAVEGIVCLAMAFPLAAILGIAGALLGHYALRPSSMGSFRGTASTLLLLLASPLLAGVEKVSHGAELVYRVDSFVEIEAAPEAVWPIVIAFPEIRTPPGLLFRAGIAYPLRARIAGHGVGAVRYCEFSTGPFVEPITVWDAPRRLAFTVSKNPSPMRELSWTHIHPPHLENFLVSRQGEFRLEPLPGGGTRLHGSTWYSHGLQPAAYWRIWSDSLIHAIHLRVLEHIRDEAERRAKAQE
ncbi:MAG: SRPBCC family protein [Bryobacter sp.]|nr:SRPBCC family protein [Bryobacter sp.]